MKIVVLSDTHRKHNKIDVPEGDVLIHCGDFTNEGKYSEIKCFFEWFLGHKHKYKICIPGNHEVGICDRHYVRNIAMYNNSHYKLENYRASWEYIDNITKKEGVYFLIDQGIEIEGVKFYGSPWCGGDPSIMNRWGYYVKESSKRVELFSKIPEDIDVLITHDAPYGIMDECSDGNIGCKELLDILMIVKPKVHVFGHVHEGYGRCELDGVSYYNCSVMDGDYKVMNKCVEIQI